MSHSSIHGAKTAFPMHLRKGEKGAMEMLEGAIDREMRSTKNPLPVTPVYVSHRTSPFRSVETVVVTVFRFNRAECFEGMILFPPSFANRGILD